MNKKSLYNLHAEVSKALSNPIRIEIIDLLKDSELSFGEIAKKTAQDRKSVV